jgi:hypothetical protein
MSVLLQQNNAEIFRAVDGTAAPLLFKGGIPYDGESLFAVDTVGDVDHYHQGLPFTAEGRLAVEGAPPVTYNSGAAPITATGKLSTAIVVIPNLYVNPQFAGGGVNTACDGHEVIFETNEYDYQPIGDGYFEYLSNTNDVNGRSPQQFALNVNNPDLVVGQTYLITYEYRNTSDLNYGAAMAFTNDSGITITSEQRRALPNSQGKLFIEFTVDDPTYTANVRVGCGTTANNGVQLAISRPVFIDTELPAGDDAVVWNGGVPYTDDGRVLITVEG